MDELRVTSKDFFLEPTMSDFSNEKYSAKNSKSSSSRHPLVYTFSLSEDIRRYE